MAAVMSGKLIGSPAFKLVAGAVIAYMAPVYNMPWLEDAGDSSSYARLQDRIMMQRGQQKSVATSTPALSMSSEQLAVKEKKRPEGSVVSAEMVAREADVLHAELRLTVTQHHALELDVSNYSIPSLELDDLREWFPLPQTRSNWKAPVETKRVLRPSRRAGEPTCRSSRR